MTKQLAEGMIFYDEGDCYSIFSDKGKGYSSTEVLCAEGCFYMPFAGFVSKKDFPELSNMQVNIIYDKSLRSKIENLIK